MLYTMRMLICFIFLLLIDKTYTTIKWVPTKSSVTFKIRNAGLMVTGSLSGLQTEIQFDPENLSQSHISATLDTRTIDTGIGLRDKHLRKEEYFYTEKYPLITMTSVQIRKVGPDQYEGDFKLTIKQTTQNVTLPFVFHSQGTTGEFKGDLTINRLDYKVGSSSWVMDDQVTIHITITVTQ